MSLNADGDSVVDHLVVAAGKRLESVEDDVKSFFKRTRPVSVVIGTGAGMEGRRVMRDLNRFTSSAVTEWKDRHNRDDDSSDEDDDDDDDDDGMDVERKKRRRERRLDGMDNDFMEDWDMPTFAFVDDNVAQLFARSPRGKREFPEFSVQLRGAVGLARYAKDPLAEIASIWSVISETGIHGVEMLYLNLHPLQKTLPRHLLLRSFERVLCDSVCKVGVDINAAAECDHLGGTLQFIPGLGPRKALAMRQVSTLKR